ncbi:hypothetical protein VH571_15940 [Frondihabitans sp. 4ASC-45]|uniref:hypothetical protein n=1 Tax=Frondihabitans sp. 4ASC-45 TaxID=3111636 RepID=UPI003C24A71A
MPEYSPTDLRQLDVLGKLIRATDERATNPQALPQDLLHEGAGHDATSALRDEIRALEAADLIVVDWRFNGGWSAKPTGAGRDAWAALDTARNDRRARRFQLRDVYLSWVVDQDDDGASPVPEQFFESGATYLGVPYTQDDLERTGEYLFDHGYIKGPRADQRPDPLRPLPTAKGRYTVEQGISVNAPAPRDAAPAGDTYNNHFNGPTNVAQGSHDVQQTINITWQDQARNFVDEISGRLDRIEDEQVRAELTSATDELRAEVNGEARPNQVRAVVSKIAMALGTAAASEVGTDVMQHALQLVGVLPA